MEFVDVERFRGRRVYFEVMPRGGRPLMGEAKVVELTPEEIVLQLEDGPDAKTPAEGKTLRHRLTELVSIQPA